MAAVASRVLAQINAARRAAGVAPLVMDARLVAAAKSHSDKMAAGCGLTHTCDGEASFGDRIVAQGVTTRPFGENVGAGGPVARTTDAVWSMAQTLTAQMLAQQPPKDQHKRNILDTDFHLVGIAVSVDASGKVWLTQDFAG
jgi:uncharacterized protein YkwD